MFNFIFFRVVAGHCKSQVKINQDTKELEDKHIDSLVKVETHCRCQYLKPFMQAVLHEFAIFELYLQNYSFKNLCKDKKVL